LAKAASERAGSRGLESHRRSFRRHTLHEHKHGERRPITGVRRVQCCL